MHQIYSIQGTIKINWKSNQLLCHLSLTHNWHWQTEGVTLRPTKMLWTVNSEQWTGQWIVNSGQSGESQKLSMVVSLFLNSCSAHQCSRFLWKKILLNSCSNLAAAVPLPPLKCPPPPPLPSSQVAGQRSDSPLPQYDREIWSWKITPRKLAFFLILFWNRWYQ